MHRHRLRLTGILSVAALLLALGFLALSQRSAAAQEQNLLANPSFEGQYSAFIPPAPISDCPSGTCGTAQTADGWTPWWQTVTGVLDPAIYGNPEYKPAEASDFANRVHSGARAQQYFNFGRTSTAGLFQTVTVPANSALRFSVWGQAWSTGIGWDCELCDVPYSGEPTVMNMRVGIDPTGGTDPFSPSIVWSGTASPYDQYALFSVEATAQGDRVTVFTYSSPAEVRKHNDIYWDDASLVVIGGGGFVPAPVSGDGDDGGGQVVAAPVFFELQPTATPDAEGVIYAAVPPGGSIWSVAANAGITLDEILEYNNFSRDAFVMVGDLLIVGYGEPGGSEAESTEAEAETDAEAKEAPATPEAAPEATPPAPAEVGGDSAEAPDTAEAVALSAPDVAVAAPAPSGGSICLKAFLDNNENGLHDPGEPLKSDVAFTVALDQRVVSNYVTTGSAEPYCIAGLAPGNYQVTRSQTTDEVLTTRGDWGVALNEGTVVTMEFGSKLVPAVAAADTASADTALASDTTAAAQAAQSGSAVRGNTIITVAAVVLAVLLLGVVVALLLSTRRS